MRSLKYCPSCGAEYLDHVSACPDCGGVPLVDSPGGVAPSAGPVMAERVSVFLTGRRMDAELVRARLEADGLDARIWSSGMGAWRMESGLTEITGVPNAFNAHQVVVPEDEAERAREVLAEDVLEPEPDQIDETSHPLDRRAGWMQSLTARWLLRIVALVVLFIIVVPYLD